MFRQDSSNPILPPVSPELRGSSKRSHRFFYAIFAGLVIIVAIIAVLFTSGSFQNNFLISNSPLGSSSLELGLNYAVGDHMVYETTNVVTNQMVNTSLSLPGVTKSQSFNSTITMDVLSANSENYTINEAMTTNPLILKNPLPPLKLNITKASYYNNFIAPGAPLIFYNATDPTILAYLSQPSVKVGDVWNIPVNTGNASLGLTGEVTLRFAGIQAFTTPAGTFQTMRIEVSSSVLSLHSDGTSLIKIPDGMTLQLNGTSYVEQGTCRLVKADLTQLSTTNSPGVGSTSTMYTEKTLVEFTKP